MLQNIATKSNLRKYFLKYVNNCSNKVKLKWMLLLQTLPKKLKTHYY